MAERAWAWRSAGTSAAWWAATSPLPVSTARAPPSPSRCRPRPLGIPRPLA